jgi:hypothetical protein
MLGNVLELGSLDIWPQWLVISKNALALGFYTTLRITYLKRLKAIKKHWGFLSLLLGS